MKRYNAVYAGINNNIRVIASSEKQAIEKLERAGYKKPLKLVLVVGMDSYNFKGVVE